eukprot:Rmarinus@m.4241
MAELKFGKITIPLRHVFAQNSFSYAVVNLKPCVPGHMMVISKRVVPRFEDLSEEEVSSLWSLVHKIAPRIVAHFGGTSTTFAIQDGPEAGQTIPHVHVHIIPRRSGDFAKNDDVYGELEKGTKSGAEGCGMDLDQHRVVHNDAQMTEEALVMRRILANGETDGNIVQF